METFFNVVKTSVRTPDELGDYFTISPDGEKDSQYFDGDEFRIRLVHGSVRAQQPVFWLEELPVLTEVLFSGRTCKSLADFTLNVETDDRYASASRVALQAYAYTIQDHDARLAKVLYHCVNQKP